MSAADLARRTPEQVAADTLAAHAIKPHWRRTGEQVAALIAEAVAADREARMASAEYDALRAERYAPVPRATRLADAVRALIEPPATVEPPEAIARRLLGAAHPLGGHVSIHADDLADAVTAAVQAGIQAAWESWEPSDEGDDEAMPDLSCAECGTGDAETYVVTYLDGDQHDRTGRTEVCIDCYNALNFADAIKQGRDALARYGRIEYWGTANAPANIARMETAGALRDLLDILGSQKED